MYVEGGMDYLQGWKLFSVMIGGTLGDEFTIVYAFYD